MEKRLFLKRISDTIEEYKMMPHGATVICGVSGGADSVAMLLALSELSVHVCAAHLNHAMRGDESDRDEAFVRALCDRKCIELYTERLAIPPESEDAARHARYSFFERAAAACGADKIATAHNANDSLETMIFNILRGTGLAGISGIPPVRDNIIRPLTEVARADIVEYLNDIGQDWVVDSTNVDVRYSRNLIRKEIIPCMEEINPRAVANSARAARMLREDDIALNAAAQDFLAENSRDETLPITLKNLPAAVSSRAIRIFIKKLTKEDLEFSHICDIISLMRREATCASCTLPGGFIARRVYDRIIIMRDEPFESFDEFTLKKGESACVAGFKITCNAPEITVRPRRTGDCIKLFGRTRKTIKKLFIEEKIPRHLRNNIPIIVRSDEIIAVAGVGMSEDTDIGGATIEPIK